MKFNQEIEDYSVFEFDCPAGLSFDERTEVCVWPGSLPEGSPCPGSSEIPPVAPKRFECSQVGYYADPQNCRWFFACMDLGVLQFMRNELFIHRSYVLFKELFIEESVIIAGHVILFNPHHCDIHIYSFLFKFT